MKIARIENGINFLFYFVNEEIQYKKQMGEHSKLYMLV